MTIAVNSTAQAVGTNATKTGFGALGSGDFIKLMTTQMQQQDPFDPMDNKDMLAQMAQFSALSQTNDVSEGVSAVNATLKQLGAKLDAILTAQQAAAAVSADTQIA
ncbi:MAG: flagellar hook capping FlgD N-terminal domain-containing protein [Pseudomonadota bacterium]